VHIRVEHCLVVALVVGARVRHVLARHDLVLRTAAPVGARLVLRARVVVGGAAPVELVRVGADLLLALLLLERDRVPVELVRDLVVDELLDEYDVRRVGLGQLC